MRAGEHLSTSVFPSWPEEQTGVQAWQWEQRGASSQEWGHQTYDDATWCMTIRRCHLMYDDKHMLKVVQHATASAFYNQEATATFLLL